MNRNMAKRKIEGNVFMEMNGYTKTERGIIFSVLARNLRDRGLNARKYDGHLIIKTDTNKLSLRHSDIEHISPEKNLIWIYGKDHSLWVKIQNNGIMEILS